VLRIILGRPVFNHSCICSIRILQCAAILSIATFFAGCGSGTSAHGTGGSGVAPAIVVQPANQSVPMGLPASFFVTANGSSLSYQWSKDGTQIAGATGDTYVTPVTQFSDTGSTYSVTVSNALGSAASSSAALTVTARAPKAGDLRFQQVDAPSTVNGYAPATTPFGNDLSTPIGLSFSDAVGTTLSVSQCGTAPGCGWEFFPWAPPEDAPPLNTYYVCDYIWNLQDDLDGNGGLSTTYGIGSPNSVVTSIGLAGEFLAISSVQATQNTSDMAQHSVAPSDFQAAATGEGAQSRVITAAAIDSTGNVFYLSYGWQGDTTTCTKRP